jgi:hypothetical protein
MLRRRHRIGAWAAALATWLPASWARAHGFGQRFDLPLPLNLWIWSAGGTIVVTFLIAAVFVREAPSPSTYPRLLLARIGLTGWSTGRVLIEALRVAAAALLVLTLVAGLAGNPDPYHNLAPTMVWVLWWVGVAYSCALIGNLWGLVNPFAVLFDAASALYARLTGGRTLSRDRPYPEWLGSWPAVATFAAFTWAELIWTEKDVPYALATVALCYSGLTWLGMFIWGRAWLARGEAFSIMFGLMGRFAPIEGRREDEDRPVLAVYLRLLGVGLLDSSAVTLSFVVFVTTMLSAVSFDGFLDTPLYQSLLTAIYSSSRVEAPLSRLSELTGLEEGQLVGSVMLVVAMLVFCAALLLTTGLVRLTVHRKGGPAPSAVALACAFVLSLTPIAIAYHLAHYLSLLLTAGQFIIPLISDPFGWGWNLFGTAEYQADIGIVGPRFFWYASISAILVGHIFSVYLAHAVAIRMFGDRRTALLSQLPMVLLMVCYTMVSLWILAQPVVS